MTPFDPKEPGDLRATAAYTYDLPNELIATTPAAQRDASRLMVVAANGDVEHRTFADFPALLRSGDVLVINETRVVRARLRGTRETGGAVEVLLLRPVDRAHYDPSSRRWQALVRPARRLRLGARVRFGDDAAATVVAVLDDGLRELDLQLALPFEAFLERYGELPLPPYVGAGDEARAARYQTVFGNVPGSVAAPTASLHFTERTFDDLRARGVTVAPLVLDVGLATFKPLVVERLDDHTMHAEWYDIPVATARAVAAAKANGGRIVAAGTTVMRALESAAAGDGTVRAGAAETRLFITPGFRFTVVDALLTNFHLPGSTLLVLVSAFAGYGAVRRAYETGIVRRYRFFSFGDAMFVTLDPRAGRAPIG